MNPRRAELDEILSGYVDILNDQGPDSAEERAYLEKYAGDSEATDLLWGARTMKGLFDSFGRFSTPGKPGVRKGQRKRKSV